MQIPQKRAVILLAEDNPADQILAKRAFKNSDIVCNLQIVPDGEAALDYLYQRSPYTDAPFPDLMLLDLNMPKKNGREVLEAMALEPRFKTLPVIVLTTSQHEKDIVQSYKLGCNSFISKPIKVDQFLQVVKEIGSYWLNLVALPPKED